MPKGKLPKIKGSLCNIPVNEVYDNCKSLPRPEDSNGLLIVKLKVVVATVATVVVVVLVAYFQNYLGVTMNPLMLH